MQCRHTLPGWYGLGGAVEDFLAERPEALTTLQEMYRRWPFWQTLIDNAQMILAKADMTIARLYADLVDDPDLADRIFGRIAEEHGRAVDVIGRITGQGTLLEKMPILERSIQQRNPYVDPLSFIQLVLLRRLRSGDGPSEDLLTGVLESINGIASSGLKNTGWIPKPSDALASGGRGRAAASPRACPPPAERACRGLAAARPRPPGRGSGETREWEAPRRPESRAPPRGGFGNEGIPSRTKDCGEAPSDSARSRQTSPFFFFVRKRFGLSSISDVR